MFEIGKILKRAWQILWNYKLLWAFALLLALSGGAGNGGGGGGGSGGGSSFRGDNFSKEWGNPGAMPEWTQEFQSFFENNVQQWFATEQSTVRTIIWMIVIFALVAIFFTLLLSFIRYPSETAVMRVVNEHETTGVKYRFKQAWKLGWNRRAFRLFLIDLLIGAPATTIILSLVGVMVFLGFRLAEQGNVRFLPGAIVGIILLFMFIMLFALFMTVVGWLRQYVVRFAALEENGVWESFRQGWKMFKSNFKNTLITGLVLIGIGIGFGFAMILAVFLLIPAYAILAIPGAIAAAIPGGLAYFVTTLFAQGVWPWIIAAVFAVPVFFTIVFSPLSFLGGMLAVFTSNVWTLVYRQLKGSIPPPPVPALSSVPEIPA